MTFGERMAEKAALGRALRRVQDDSPGLMTLARLRELYARGEIELSEYERGLDIALQRETAHRAEGSS
jgi:uncharacterized membrane protein